MRPGPDDHRRPRSRVFDVMIGASVTALIGVAVLVGIGYFDVSTPYSGAPIPHGATPVNRCRSLVLEKLPDDGDVDFSEHQTSERRYPDRSWVIRGQVEVDLVEGDSRDGEYLCDHLRDLPPGSENWRADQVLLLGV